MRQGPSLPGLAAGSARPGSPPAGGCAWVSGAVCGASQWMSASVTAYAGSTRTSSPAARRSSDVPQAAQHDCRGPARHQSRTSSPELLESGPPDAHAHSARSRSRCSRPMSNCSFSRTTRQSCAASSSGWPACRAGAGQARRPAPAGCARAGGRSIRWPRWPRTAHSHGAVEALDCQVGQLLGQLRSHVQLRMPRLEFRSRRPQPQRPKPKVAARRMRPTSSVVPLLQLRLHRLEARRAGASARSHSASPSAVGTTRRVVRWKSFGPAAPPAPPAAW